MDDGVRISVFLSGPFIDPKFKQEPSLVATPTVWPEGKNIAFFNREYVAGTNHESNLDNIVIRHVGSVK